MPSIQQQQHHHQQQQPLFNAMTMKNNNNELSQQEQQQTPHSAAAPDFSFNDEPIYALDDASLLSGQPHTSANSATASVMGTADDFFSSPEWTDPSPALTTSMSFQPDSCDTSPLLTDINEVPELAGVPLFGDQIHFSLFPENTDSAIPGGAAPTAKRSPQNAFHHRAKDIRSEESALLLLRALSSSAISSTPGAAEAVKAVLDASPHGSKATTAEIPVSTASPAAILSPLPPSALAPPTPATSSIRQSPSQQQQRGTKRRVETSDLLPMDAPIQPRTYRTPSSTSRKASVPPLVDDIVPSVSPEINSKASNADPITAKRLSNTLAARRSRHRKAEELRELHDTIEDLTSQVEMWKRRCMRAEQERDQTFAGQS